MIFHKVLKIKYKFRDSFHNFRNKLHYSHIFRAWYVSLVIIEKMAYTYWSLKYSAVIILFLIILFFQVRLIFLVLNHTSLTPHSMFWDSLNSNLILYQKRN